MPIPLQGHRERAEAFLHVAADFDLGELPTEVSHPRSATLSQTARQSAAAGLAMLFDIDRDVLAKYDEWSRGEQPGQLSGAVLDALRRGRRIFFTGCGATGRLSIQLDSIWRAFWQRRRQAGLGSPSPDRWENRTCSVMAGGDYALIRAVEGFEDFAPFGRRQIADAGVAEGDVVFAITEGGETPFVIGTAWQGIESGARVFFVYNNPDDVLRARVRRSREVLDEPRIEKINLTTGPMAVTGSTRMQATSMQLLALLTVVETVLRTILTEAGAPEPGVGTTEAVPDEMRAALQAVHVELTLPEVLSRLAGLVEAEERTYRVGGRCSYLAGSLGVDVLTDTTERSPTFCTPPFRKWDDRRAVDSWAFLFTPQPSTNLAWHALLGRRPQTIEWSEADLGALLEPEAAARQAAVLCDIGLRELSRFRIGLDGLPDRPVRRGDGVTAVVRQQDAALLSADGVFRRQFEEARRRGGWTALAAIGDAAWLRELTSDGGGPGLADAVVPVRLPATRFLLEAPARIGGKLLLNALSTCTMVRLGRVLGNRMIWVVPSNLKLIDRAIRYIRDLAGVPYAEACRTLFEVMDYVEPRRQSGQAYPAPVGVAVMRLSHGLSFPEAESRLGQELGTRLHSEVK